MCLKNSNVILAIEFNSMRKAISLFLVLMIIALYAYPQEKISGTVRGIIIDTAGKQNLSEASVSVLNATDSGAEAFTVTDKQGAFFVKNLGAGSYRLLITFQGY